jgi:hypothetical protein
MPLPEISRRCLACGAAVRPGARFCPQCGYNLVAEGAVEAARETPPAESVAEVRDTAPPWAAEETARDEPRPLRATRDVETFDGRATPTTRETSAPAPVPATRETAARTFDDGGLRETADAGRSRRAAARVRETVMPRVEKMREEALVVLDETPDDSGLRFVLIAVVLFGLFLLFLLLSTTVLR